MGMLGPLGPTLIPICIYFFNLLGATMRINHVGRAENSGPENAGHEFGGPNRRT